MGVSVGSCLNYTGLRAGLWEVLSWVGGGGRRHPECGQDHLIGPWTEWKGERASWHQCACKFTALCSWPECVWSLLSCRCGFPITVNSQLEPWAKANLSPVPYRAFVGAVCHSQEVRLSHPNTMSVISPLCWLALTKSLVLQGVHLEKPLSNTLPVKFGFAKHLSFTPELLVYLVTICF